MASQEYVNSFLSTVYFTFANLFFCFTADLIFKQMKVEIDGMIAHYGEEDAPPPWSLFTVSNAIGEGNMHIVQKVFEGPFEVRRGTGVWRICNADTSTVRRHLLFRFSRLSGDL